MRVLVACEYSGVVRDAFTARGHYAMSCDLLPTETDGLHYQGNVLDILDCNWDLMIAHPPCTYLTSTGARWLDDPRYPRRRQDMEEASNFFLSLYYCGIPSVCVENPVGVMSSRFRRPDQYVHPYHFGDPVAKKTGLWLKNLPLLKPTNEVDPNADDMIFSSGKRMSRWFYETSCLPQKDRAHARSKTFQGMAKAMAEQWG